MEFTEMNLEKEILRGVASAGYLRPLPIQEQAIPLLLLGRDLIGRAKTGSGKTAAFGLPLLQAVDPSSNSVQALVLCPTRELAQQDHSELEKLGRHKEVRLLAIYGGEDIAIQLAALERSPQVVVGTPGRVVDHLHRGTLNLAAVRFLVLDEADRMLDIGFKEQIEFILRAVPQNRQIALVSATLPPAVVDLSRRYLHDPVTVMLDSDAAPSEQLEQYYAFVERDEKLERLFSIIASEKPLSTIVFCRTRNGARRLSREFEKRFMNGVSLHGGLSQAQRDHSMFLFRSGRADVLVATDVASRGLDISRVDCIINYDVPEEPLDYIHRVGRTARAGRQGKSFLLVSTPERGDFERVLTTVGGRIEPMRERDSLRTTRSPAASVAKTERHQRATARRRISTRRRLRRSWRR